MNALRAWLRLMAAGFYAQAATLTDGARLARVWAVVAGGAFVGAVFAPGQAAGVTLALIGLVTAVMAWLNASGKVWP